eukprot:TRINITY_DN10486_c0_g1_i1.p1 TRINITY_DN10486_c0_g1~~TRINITY_DN10486_c0_g1_i1.p1  ORF type:complete len:401 (+),score=29.61 TRINITY_DN10486_c0_g1_i1:137-1204(+)
MKRANTKANAELERVRKLHTRQEEELTSDVEATQEKLQRAQQDFRALEHDVTELRLAVRRLQSSEEALTKRLAESETEASLVAEERDALRTKMAMEDHEGTLNRLQAMEARAEREAEQAARDMARLRDQVSAFEELVSETERKARATQQQHERTQAELNAARRETNQAEAQASELRDRLAQLQRQTSLLHGERDMEERALEEEREAHLRTRKAISDQAKLIEAGKARERKLSHKLQLAEGEREHLAVRLAKLDAAGSLASSTLHLQEEVQRLQREAEEGARALKQMSSEMKKRNQMVMEYEERLQQLSEGGSTLEAQEYAAKYQTLIGVNRKMEKKIKSLEAKVVYLSSKAGKKV